MALPFVVKPRLAPITETLGSEESGKIEIERRGYLTVAEKSYYQQAMSGDTSMAEVQAIARRIARQHGMEYLAVMEMIGKAMAGGEVAEHEKILEESREEIAVIIMTLMQSQERQRACQALTLLINRIDGDLDPSEVFKLHPDLIDDLVALFGDEEKKSVEALESAQRSLADVEPTAVEEVAEGK